MTVSSTKPADRSLATIVALAADGHAYAGIVYHLNCLGIPTASGRGQWSNSTVYKLAQAHGIKVAYSPHKIAAAKLRDAEMAATAQAMALVDALRPGPETLSFTAEALKRACGS